MEQEQLPCKNCITLAMCKALVHETLHKHPTQITARGLKLTPPDRAYLALYRKCSLIRFYTSSVYMEEGLKPAKVIDHNKKNELLLFFKIPRHSHETTNKKPTVKWETTLREMYNIGRV